MSLTRDQQILIEPAIRRSWKTWKIAADFGLPMEDVIAWRAERRNVKKVQRAIRRDQRIRQADRDMVPIAGGHDPKSVDGGGLLAALRAHMPALVSLTENERRRDLPRSVVIGWAA